MFHPSASRPASSPLSTSRRPLMLGTLLLGAVLAGCGPQGEAAPSEGLQHLSQHSRTDSAYAVAYADQFSGASQNLLPGLYSSAQLSAVGVNALSSLTVPVGWRVTLYSGNNLTGSSLLVRQDTDLSAGGFDNKTASLNVESSVTLYRDDHFHGATQYLGIGAYDTAQLATVRDNALSSLRVAPGWKVTLYAGSGFTGASRVITQDTDFWTLRDSFNDQTSSLKVEGPVTLFQNDGYGSPNQGLQAGYYSVSQLDFPASLSSLKVAPGWTVTLYEGPDFTGESRVITSDTDLWANGDFNDQTNSLKVEGPAL